MSSSMNLKDKQTHRLTRMREALREQGADAWLIRDTSSIYWVSSFDHIFDEEAAHALLVDDVNARIHTDSRYSESMRRANTADVIEVDDTWAAHTRWAVEHLSAGSALAIEQSMTLGEYRSLMRAIDEAAQLDVGTGADASAQTYESDGVDSDSSVEPIRVIETSGVLLGLRAQKDEDEIARMQHAQDITDAAFAELARWVRPGMREIDVARELERLTYAHGATGLAFPSIVAAGANGALPHAQPGETILEAGQCVVLDFGAKAFGYCSDMTRMLFIGQPDRELERAYEVLRQANEESEAMIRAGVLASEVHNHAEEVLAQGGYKGRMGHALGHGVGIDIHELPVLAPRNKKPLEAGNVVTVEPGIYIPGEFGMRLEDFGVVTADGYHVFTKSTHDMVII